MKKTKYQIKSGSEWITCKKAIEVKNGFLHYELSDSTNGLARPGAWRVKPV